MDTSQNLTAANIRYLLTMKAFSDANKTIRNSYLADYLHYKKSSVHSMLQNLTALGMIEKDENNVIRLTEKGADTALRYQAYFRTINLMMQKYFPHFSNRENAVLALLAEIPEEDLQHFAEQK